MQLGPFDGRRKRSRCARCSASHLKCSGEQPCSNCAKKSLACSYGSGAAATPVIFVEGGRHRTPDCFVGQSSAVRRRSNKVLSPAPLAGPGVEDECYMYYFQIFSQRNNFTGKKGQFFADEVKHLSGAHASPFFLDSLRALGALQAAKLLPSEDKSGNRHVYSSVVFYAKAVASLRESLEVNADKMSEATRTALLWTTLFLGMYELMNEATVMGWVQHMVHGTGRGLEAAGPSICSTPAGAKFYLQARVFEVCRTILFNAPTFLTRPEWVRASRKIWKSEGFKAEWRPLDSLLDIMVSCSAMRVRAAAFIREQDEEPTTEVPDEGRHVAAAGWALREALAIWHKAYLSPEAGDDGEKRLEDDDDSMLLARLFYAAISIYLSGNFDWDMMHWRRWPEVEVPRLDQETVQQHADKILEITTYALGRRSVSPLLFLFPLRIAGARVAGSPAQCAAVLGLIGRIAGGFAVAHAVTYELVTTWEELKVGLTGLSGKLRMGASR